MTTTTPTPTSLATLLAQLAHRPCHLVALLLLLNALTHPYLGFIHDARLYSGQVLQAQDPDFWQGDLFFRFGSQDRFSLFSRLAVPLVTLVGIDLAFFVLYLAGLALFISGLMRLVLRLFPGSPGAVLGLMYAVMVLLPYGGLHIFHVIEPFTTPRLPASGLVLWGLAWALERRWGRCAAALGAGMMLHPLMAYAGVLVALALALWEYCRPRVLVVSAAAAMIVGGLLGAVPGLARNVLGHFDEEWSTIVRDSAFFHFPDIWTVGNWRWALASVLMIAASALAMSRVGPVPERQRSHARMLLACAAVGLLGLVGSVLVNCWDYALPIQGQPYRTLWLTSAVLPPAAFALAWNLWQHGGWARLAAALIVCYLGSSSEVLEELTWIALSVPAALFAVRTFARGSASPADRMAAIGAVSAMLGITLWGLFRVCGFAYFTLPLLPPVKAHMYYEYFVACLGPGALMSVAILFALALGRVAPAHRIVAIALAALAWQSAFFLAPRSAYADAIDPVRPAARFVAEFLAQERSDRPLTVYSDLGRLDTVWLDWKAHSYFDPCQAAGFVFARDTALEGKRRAPLVGPFELARLRAQWMSVPPALRNGVLLFHGVHVDDAAPSRADVLHLASDPQLDLIVLAHTDTAGLTDLVTAQGPDVVIIDARRLRAQACAAK